MKRNKRIRITDNQNSNKSNIKISFHTDITNGLSEEEVAAARRKYGRNRLAEVKRKSFVYKFILNLKDPIIKILIGALILNTVLMFNNINWPETIGILCAVITATLVSTISEHGSETAFEKLRESSYKGKVTVLRDGNHKEIDAEELVVGDIVLIRAGIKIPADCSIIRGEVSVSEAALTGESADIKKKGDYKLKIISDSDIQSDKAQTKLFMGCLCTKGECEAVVVGTGDHTEYGKIAKGLMREDRDSPLKERLLQLAKSVSYLGYVAAFMIIAAYLVNTFLISSSWNHSEILTKIKDIKFVASSLISAVTLGVSVIVVAVPEGLPMMITVVLSSNLKKMFRSGVLVRKMVGIETAGSMNILFTDKTGTLTTGNMSVNRVYTKDCVFKSSSELLSNQFYKILIPLMSDQLIGQTSRTPTEKALVDFCKRSANEKSKIKTVKKLPFNSDNKYSACIYENVGVENCAVLGAAEKLLDLSDRYTDSFGKPHKMDRKTLQMLHGILNEETSASSRVLSICYAERNKWDSIEAGHPEDLSFAALISIKDELRDDAAISVKNVKSAGVHVVMMTGDNTETAKAIAADAGITDPETNIVITGKELANYSDSEVAELLPRLAVVARATPTDKLRIVQISSKLGLVSGMTGDGVNDAPSLKAADVGFAIGSGSDVAKEAADIVITNDSISSITNAVLYGRCVFESIRKFITFQLTMNLCALGVSLIGPFIGIESPITVIQMLWVNIIMDTLGGLAFAGEIPRSEYMRRPPIKRTEKILSKRMIKQILFLGTYTLIVCIAFLKLPFVYENLAHGNETYFLTSFFALFIFFGIFNSFNARAPEGPLLAHISGNKAFIVIIFFVAVVQLTIIYFGGSVFRCTPLKMRDLLITAVISFTAIPADAIRKRLIK